MVPSESNPDRIEAMIRADALELCGNLDEAERLRARSLERATEFDINCYAYSLLWRNELDRAIELLERNATANPDSWNAYDSLADAYVLKGDMLSALRNYRIAARLVISIDQLRRIELRIAQLEPLVM